MTSATITRIIGIDFGTSTSVVCFKDYNEDGPLHKDDARAIQFDGRFTTVPTLVLTDPKGNQYFGYEAEHKRERYPDLLRAEFKMDLVNAQKPEVIKQARETTEIFLGYLYKTYRNQATSLYGSSVKERTFISYPAKWPDPVRRWTIEAAKNAGFPNVEGMDEPSAAMQYFLSMHTTEIEHLYKQGVLRPGVSVKILLIDMGAGTSDFVLYCFVPGQDRHRVLATWPPDDRAAQNANFGGREIDQQLWEHFVKPEASAIKDRHNLGNSWMLAAKSECKPWKENTVSPALRDEQSVDPVPSFVAQFKADQVSPGSALDRAHFEKRLAGHLRLFPQLINELVEHAVKLNVIKHGGDIDLVVLTGGHSQWYFVKDVLRGRLRLGGVAAELDRVKREPIRILHSPLPQETVARGLAMSGMPFQIDKMAANNIWLKLRIGKTDFAPILVHQAGDRLPCKKEIYQEAGFDYEAGQDISASGTLFSGRQGDDPKGKSYPPFKVTVEIGLWAKVLDWAKAYVAYVATLGLSGMPLVRLISMFVESRENRVQFYSKIEVDANEHIIAKGLVSIPWAKEIAFFVANRPSQPLLEEKEKADLLTGFLAARKAAQPPN